MNQEWPCIANTSNSATGASTWPGRAFRWTPLCTRSTKDNPLKPFKEDFPSLKRAQVYGAIAFYLDHQAEIDRYLVDTEREFEGNGVPMSEANSDLWERIQKARATVVHAKLYEFRA